MCTIWTNFVLCLLRQKDSAQITIVGHWGYGVLYRVFPEGMKVRSQPSAKDLFLRRKILHHPWRTEMLRKERGGPRHPKETGRSAVRNTACELTLLTGWANCANISKCQGHVTIFKCQRNEHFYWDTTSLVLDSLSKVCKLILLLHLYSQLELEYHTFCYTCVYPAILVIYVSYIFYYQSNWFTCLKSGDFMNQL